MTTSPTAHPADGAAPLRPFHELRDSGLLWLVNATVFHPRGFALYVQTDPSGNATGWGLLGDGTEPWVFPDGPEIDDRFKAATATLDALRPEAPR